MMNVAFVCDGFPLNADLRAVESGNPGLGGTQYMFALIASVLAKRSNEITVHFYTDAAIVFCRDLNVHVCKPGESLRCALGSANDLCIIRGNVADCDYFEVLSSPMPIITWSHNFETYDFLQKVAKANQIIANVCVSQQQLDRLRDCTAVTKSLVINNGMGFEGINCLRSSLTADSSRHVVCWLGSIVPGKGFHALASIWPDIRKAVPDAELHVIGGSDLYVLEAGKELGTLGLTEKKYEDSFSSYLVNSSGQLDKSIHLFGVMGGTQKLKVMAQSSVGVVNPLGSNETFCLSAVEFESIGVPVVSRGRGGYSM